MVIFFSSSLAKKLRVLFASASIIMLIGFTSPSFADSRLQVFLSLGSEGDLFQDIDFKDKSGEFDNEYGGGILFDWTMDTPDSIFSGGLSGHGISIEYYELGEEEDDVRLEVSGVFVGYRYHFFSRFYAGASIALNSEAAAGPGGIDPVTAQANPISYTLGYSHRFPLGLTLGVHYMNTLATDYKIDEPDRAGGITEIEDLSVRAIGATIGFRF